MPLGAAVASKIEMEGDLLPLESRENGHTVLHYPDDAERKVLTSDREGCTPRDPCVSWPNFMPLGAMIFRIYDSELYCTVRLRHRLDRRLLRL